MYRPPAASWEVGAARCPVLALFALALLGAVLNIVYWFRQAPGPSGALLGLALVACTLLSMRGLRTLVRGRLQWDGASWHWSGTEDLLVTDLVCVLDFQRCMLLRMACGPTAAHWLWLETPSMDGRWHALRRAIVASRPQDSTDGLAGP